MLFLLATLATVTLAQNTTSGGWLDKLQQLASKAGINITQITSGASDMCSNQYVSGPYIEAVLCDNVIPFDFTSIINVTFGANTDWCRGLACAYRAAGCSDPTYRIEAKIVQATGKIESCATTVGLDPQHCQTLARFVQAVPMNMKREEEDAHKAAKVAALAVAAYAPETEGLDALFVNLGLESPKKRAFSDDILNQLQVCSPLIQAGLKAIEGQVRLPLNISDALGPCGSVCGYAVCGLNILCQNEASKILSKINSDRNFNNCKPLACAHFEPAPVNVCEGVGCPNPDGFFQSTTNCLPPQVVYNPTKKDKNDCCQRCDTPCNGVICPDVKCPEPEYPRCTAYTVGKYDQFDCCNQCIDPCATKKAACPPPPTSCPQGQFLGPSRPGDCCVSCQPKCVGVSCVGAPQNAQACPAGTVYVPVKDDVSRCSDCCPSCAPQSTSVPIVDTQSASAFELAAAAGLAAAAAVNL